MLGYGKLSSWDRIAERADAILIAASGSHVRASDGSVRIDAEHSRRLPVRHAHHRIDFNRMAQFSRQLVFALNGIPTAITDIAGIFDQHHHAGTDDREAPRIVQGYGKLFSRPYALPQVMVADNQRPEHADSPIGMNQHCRNVTTMTD